MTQDEVLAAWGDRHGVCKDCKSPTWYFNYKPFMPQGTGVTFEKGRVAQAFTVWRPTGWKTPDGLFLAADASDVARIYGSLDKRQVRALRGAPPPRQEGDERLLRLQGQGVGLRAHEARRVPLPLRSPSASARRATSGMTASTGIATTGQMTA